MKFDFTAVIANEEGDDPLKSFLHYVYEEMKKMPDSTVLTFKQAVFNYVLELKLNQSSPK